MVMEAEPESDSETELEMEMEMSDLPKRCIHSPAEKHIWCHFVNITCHILTLPFEGDHDPIMSGVVSKAHYDTMVLDAILCLGASHLINQIRLNPGSAPASASSQIQGLTGIKQTLLGRAQEELSKRVVALLQSPNKPPDEHAEYEAESLLTVYLLLYLYEVSEGSGDHSWKTRLDGARSFVYDVLQRQHHHNMIMHESIPGSRSQSKNEHKIPPSCEDFECLGIDKFLMQFFSYHDILGDVTNGTKSDRDQQQRQRYRGVMGSLSALETGYYDEEHMLGMHHGLIEIISRVYTLQMDTSGNMVPSHEIITRAVNIWQDVSDWMVPESDLDLHHMYETYISAISIWILCIIHPGDVAKDKVQTMVARGAFKSFFTRWICVADGFSFAIFRYWVGVYSSAG
ncbi:hypothetical protein N7454_009770 [Penicillium verhagenii]|nr:hypothetical protein N7454_009770 [Penicillium verhagenii]